MRRRMSASVVCLMVLAGSAQGCSRVGSEGTWMLLPDPGFLSMLRAQQCPTVEHAEPSQVPTLVHVAYSNRTMDWDFGSIILGNFEDRLVDLFNDWFVVAYSPFRAVERLTPPDPLIGHGLRIHAYTDAGHPISAGGVRFLHGYSFRGQQDFTGTLTFVENLANSSGARYIELSVRNASDYRHRALGLVIRTDVDPNSPTLYSSSVSVGDISDDRIPSSMGWHGYIGEPGYVQCLSEASGVDTVEKVVELTMTYHHGDPAQIEVGLVVDGDVLLPKPPVAPNIFPEPCIIDLPEPLLYRFRWMFAVKSGGRDPTDPEDIVIDTTLLGFTTDQRYSGEGYVVDFAGLQTDGPAAQLYNLLFDQFVDQTGSGGAVIPRLGYYWSGPPLLSEHGVDFGKSMMTPVLGSGKFLEISGRKPLQGLLVETERWEGGALVTDHHTILSERERPGTMTQILPEALLDPEYVSFTPIRFVPELFRSSDGNNDGIWELRWNPPAEPAPDGCPTGGPDLVVDVQDCGFLDPEPGHTGPFDNTLAVTYCNQGGQWTGGVLTLEVDSPAMQYVGSDGTCTVSCEPKVCNTCAPGDCDSLCDDPGKTIITCDVLQTPPLTCGRISTDWRMRSPYLPGDEGCLPNSCGSTATTQHVRVAVSLDVVGDANAEDNSFEHSLFKRFEQPFEVCSGIDVCASETNCGECGRSCLDAPGVRDAICLGGGCQITACAEVGGVQRYDCDLDWQNGCEEDSTAPLELVEVVQGFQKPPVLHYQSGQTTWLHDDFDYSTDPIEDEQELHRRWSFLGSPPPPEGARIEKVQGGVDILLDVEGEDRHSVVGMYSQRRLPIPISFTAELELTPHCDVGRCEIGFGLLDELQEYRWGYVFTIDTQDLKATIWKADGHPDMPAEPIWEGNIGYVLEGPTLGDRMLFVMDYDRPTNYLEFTIRNLDSGSYKTTWVEYADLDRPFYLFMRAAVGGKFEPFSELDITLHGLYTALEYSGPLYEVTPAPLRYGGTDFVDIGHLQDPQHELKRGAVWQVMPEPWPSSKVQVPLVAVMADNLLQIHGDRYVNALLVTLNGTDGHEVHSTFYSQAGLPGEILYGAGITLPEVVRIERFFPGIFKPCTQPSCSDDLVWTPPVSTGACTGVMGGWEPSVDVQMSGARPGRSEMVIVTTCNAHGVADEPELVLRLDGILKRIAVPYHCSCVVQPWATPTCHTTDCWAEAVVTCDLPDLGSGVCVQTRLEVDVETPSMSCHNVSCDPANLTEVEVSAVLSWDDPQDGRLDLPPYTLKRYADCSWDPNVKLAVPESPGTVTAGGLLHYFIFYENDPQATASAIDVRITDELDPDLDETTLSMISNGGWYDPVTRTITWELTGINLAPGDGGHVEFFVRTLPGLAPGTVIEDQASIVFDFNPPVLTPPTVHMIAEPADTSAPRMHPCFDPPLLWPPNHKLVPVVIDTWVNDDSGGPVSLAVFVETSEPEQGSGYGNKAPDWTEPVIDQETGMVELELRSERYDAHQGRTYTIHLEAMDQAGNVGTTSVEVVVPGNMSHYGEVWSELMNDSRYAHCQF